MVRINDRPVMTPAVNRGRKATNLTNKTMMKERRGVMAVNLNTVSFFRMNYL